MAGPSVDDKVDFQSPRHLEEGGRTDAGHHVRECEQEIEELNLAYQDLATAWGLRGQRLPAYRSLWRLVLAGCGLESLPGLSSFAALGLLDVSRNNLKPQVLQLAVGEVELLRLRATMNPPMEAAGMVEIYRGFLVHALPRVWCLDGTFVTHAERDHWDVYFTEGRGRFAELKRKFYVDPRTFVPTRTRSNLLQLQHRHQHSQPVGPDLTKRLSPRGKELLGRMPRSFAMPKDRELCQLDTLCRDVELDVRAWALGAEHMHGLASEGFVEEDADCASEKRTSWPHRSPTATFPDRFVRMMVMEEEKNGGLDGAARATLALLLLASLIPGMPPHLVNDIVNHVFLSVDSSTCLNLRWWSSCATPFRWPPRLQLDLITLLIATLTLEDNSAMAGFSMNPHLRRCIRLFLEIILDYGPGSPAACSPPCRLDPASSRQSLPPGAAVARRSAGKRPPREAFAEALADFRRSTIDSLTLEILVLLATLAPDPSTFVDCFDDLRSLFAQVSEAVHAAFPLGERLARYRLNGKMGDFAQSVEAKFLLTCAAEELLAATYVVARDAGAGEPEADAKPPLNIVGGKILPAAACLALSI